MTNAERGVSAAGGREALTPDERRAYDKLVDAYQGRFPLSGNGALAVLELIDRLAALAPRLADAECDAAKWRECQTPNGNEAAQRELAQFRGLLEKNAAMRERLAAAEGAEDDREDAERWRFVRRFFSTDGDVTDDSASAHLYEFVIVNDEELHRQTCRDGIGQTVESLVDAARAAVAGAGEASDA
jgi:hypothetical protein